MVSLPETAVADQPARANSPHPSRARWVAAAFLILYGFAKLNGSQFTVLDSELTKPMGEAHSAYLAVFRDANRRDHQHHFEVGEDGVVRVWETWLRKGELIIEGRVVSDSEMELAPVDEKGAAVLLRRASGRGR
jgi:hypothetical protein